jgi:hypothetical protein
MPFIPIVECSSLNMRLQAQFLAQAEVAHDRVVMQSSNLSVFVLDLKLKG